MVTELAAALIGSLATYAFDTRRRAAEEQRLRREAFEERRRARAAAATAILVDLQTLEPILRQLYQTATPTRYGGGAPPSFYGALKAEAVRFGPRTVHRLAAFFRLVDDLFEEGRVLKEARVRTEEADYSQRCKAAYALQAMPEARARLLEEGGELPPPRAIDTVTYPQLPTVPNRLFPDQPAFDTPLPPELL